MARLNLVIGDRDEAYLESLSSFLILNYSHRFNISSFSRQECLEKYISGVSEKIDILLVSDNMNSDLMKPDNINCFIILTEKNENISMNMIGKFQQGDKLIGSILNIFSENSNSRLVYKSTGKKTRVISVFSPQGGSGKTSIALSTCIQCARKGLKVFYLNLEGFNSTPAFFESTGPCFSNIIFYTREKNKNLALKIESTRSIDPVWRIHYFSPAESDTEINEMALDELKGLIDQIVSLGEYDFVVIDMSSCLGEKNINLLKYSDGIVLTLVQGLYSKVKLQRFTRDFALIMEKDANDYRSKLSIVLNRFTQGPDSCFEGLTDDNEHITIPEIQDFEINKIVNTVKMDNRYVEAIDRLIKRYADIN